VIISAETVTDRIGIGKQKSITCATNKAHPIWDSGETRNRVPIDLDDTRARAVLGHGLSLA
jgi:hypothetical protein